MKRVFSAADAVFVGFLRSVLDENGIPCTIRNEYLQGGIGELPPVAVWPELWILDDADESEALRLIEAVTAGQS